MRYFLIGLGLIGLIACGGSRPGQGEGSPNEALAEANAKEKSKSDSLKNLALGPEEEMLFAEATEFLNLGLESFRDSLWFQAGEEFDSALVRISSIEATDSLSTKVYAMAKIYRDSVQNLLIQTVAKTSTMTAPVPLSQQFDEEMEDVSDSSVQAIDSIIHRINPKDYDLPLPTPLEPRIIQAISVFMGPGRGYFTKWLNRKSRYEELIQKKLAERGLPKDLMYLAMVESGFNPKAWSKAAASGMWQFISGTGRRYGLHDDWWYDPRRDPLMATDAALDYLGDLFEEFQDWNQAMAAYNCGEGRIRRYRAQDSTLSYWKMPLPQETKFYVPKILAAMIIGHNPGRYGFSIDRPESPLVFDTVTISHCISIAAIAKAAGVPEDTIVSLNPSLRRWCTPPNKQDFRIHVPVGTRDLFLQNYEAMDKTQLVIWHHHIVLKGETIAGIAAKYRISVASIKATNKIKGSRLHKGQSLLIPLVPADAGKYSEADIPESSGGKSKYKSATYKVRAGDNLFDIARKFNTTVSKLRKANNLGPHAKVRRGQTIKLGSREVETRVYEPEVHREPAVVQEQEIITTKVKVKEAKATVGALASEKIDSEKSVTEKPVNVKPDRENSESDKPVYGKPLRVKYQSYTVGSNETIFSISVKLGVTQDEIRGWNGIRGNRIVVGQKLKYLGKGKKIQTQVPEDEEADIKPGSKPETKPESKSEAKEYYLVKAGDTLWDISTRYKCTVKKIKELNSGLPPILKAGTRIRVK